MRCGRSSSSSSPVGSSPSSPRCAIVRRAAHRLRSKPSTFSSSTLGSSSDTARRASKGRPTTPSIGTRSSVTSPSCKRDSGRSYRDISSATNQLGWREAVFSTPAENRQPPRRVPSPITVRRFLRIHGRGCVYAETCVYARGCVNAPPVYTHPPLAYTHRPAYTHPGAYMHPLRIRTHRSRKRTHPRIRTRVRIRTRCVYAPTARVNAPTRVYAPTTTYKHICVYAASGA